MNPLLALRTPFLALAVIFLFGIVSPVEAQGMATLRAQENLRAEPQGAVIGRLRPGASFPILEERELWLRVEVAGWVWLPSLQITDRNGFDLAISAAPGENLRAEPQGEIRAFLSEGALLQELGEVTGWKRVRREAWVWRASVEVKPEADVGNALGGEEPAPRSGLWRSGVDGAPLLSVPDGDTLARAHPGAELQVLAREGNWVRVRLEGWAWSPSSAPPDSLSVAPDSLLTPGDVAENPGAFRGRVVSWDLQFISLERAERIRTDFYEGEPFLLARTPTSGSTFVYVAVPPDRLEEFRDLTPLERVRVTGRIRTGAAALTGNPVLDLLELVRVSGS